MGDASRLDALRRMLERRPDDARLRFGLALEYLKQEQWEDAVGELRRYLDATDDEGNAWGRLGSALDALGRTSEAADAFRSGIEAARRHGHPTMAEEFEATLAELKS